MGIHSAYLWLTMIALRVFETAPYWFYREPKEPIVARVPVRKAESPATV